MGRKSFYLRVTLDREVNDSPAAFPRLGGRGHIYHPRLLRILEAARREPRLKAILLSIKSPSLGWAQAEELRTEMVRFRASGRRIAVYLESGSQKDYFMACAGEQIVVPPAGTLELVGLRLDSIFLSSLLRQLGVRAELMKVGKYKTAGEIFQREDFSEANREMLASILKQFQQRLVQAAGEREELREGDVEAILKGGPYTATEALQEGLVDRLGYEDEIEDRLEKEGLAPLSPARLVPSGGWLRRLWTIRRPRVALIVADGMIAQGESKRRAGHRQLLGHRSLAAQLQAAREHRKAKAVVLRINSPGGSSLASDLLWREIVRLREKKPVIVSLGNVAASGGYYLATGASEIIAAGTTLTGSIGVVGGKFSIVSLLRRLRISFDSVETSSRAGISSPFSSLSEKERERLQKQMEEFYENLFLPRVADARRLSVEEVRPAAEGRVWTGSDALERNLLDRAGSLNDAIERAREAAGIKKRKFRLEAYAHRRSLMEWLPLPFSGSPPDSRERIFLLADPDIEIR